MVQEAQLNTTNINIEQRVKTGMESNKGVQQLKTQGPPQLIKAQSLFKQMLQTKANDYFQKNIDVTHPPEKRSLLFQKRKFVQPQPYIADKNKM